MDSPPTTHTSPNTLSRESTPLDHNASAVSDSNTRTLQVRNNRSSRSASNKKKQPSIKLRLSPKKTAEMNGTTPKFKIKISLKDMKVISSVAENTSSSQDTSNSLIPILKNDEVEETESDSFSSSIDGDELDEIVSRAHDQRQKRLAEAEKQSYIVTLKLPTKTTNRPMDPHPEPQQSLQQPQQPQQQQQAALVKDDVQPNAGEQLQNSRNTVKDHIRTLSQIISEPSTPLHLRQTLSDLHQSLWVQVDKMDLPALKLLLGQLRTQITRFKQLGKTSQRAQNNTGPMSMSQFALHQSQSQSQPQHNTYYPTPLSQTQSNVDHGSRVFDGFNSPSTILNDMVHERTLGNHNANPFQPIFQSPTSEGPILPYLQQFLDNGYRQYVGVGNSNPVPQVSDSSMHPNWNQSIFNPQSSYSTQNANLFKKKDNRSVNPASIQISTDNVDPSGLYFQYEVPYGVDASNDDDDDEIAEQSMILSLLDPLSGKRLSNPVRSRFCSHVECFELESFLEMNSLRPFKIGVRHQTHTEHSPALAILSDTKRRPRNSALHNRVTVDFQYKVRLKRNKQHFLPNNNLEYFNCPICNLEFSIKVPGDLYVIREFKSILDQLDPKSSINKIEISKDGSWKFHEEKPKVKTEAVEVVELDDNESLIDDNDKSNPKSNLADSVQIVSERVNVPQEQLALPVNSIDESSDEELDRETEQFSNEIDKLVDQVMSSEYREHHPRKQYGIQALLMNPSLYRRNRFDGYHLNRPVEEPVFFTGNGDEDDPFVID